MANFSKDFKERKEKFWIECQECAARHNGQIKPEHSHIWDEDAVSDFFLHYAAANKKGQMRWELEEFWDIRWRMVAYMKRRRYLVSYWDIKLERARGKKAAEKTTTQLRAEAMEQEAQNAYDKFFEEQEARGKMKEEK